MTNKNGVLPNTGSQISILSLIGVILLLISAVFGKNLLKRYELILRSFTKLAVI